MTGNERALLEQLEPRILLSASPAPESASEVVEVDAQQNAAEMQHQLISEIVFVDTSVENYEDLISGLDANIEVVLIDVEENGIDKISSVLANREGINALHIISHGSSSEVFLGNISLSNESIDSFTSQLAGWQSSFTESADILIYGCNVGENVELIQSLAEKTDADVAASDDVTGVGGNAELEVKYGEINEHTVIDQNSFQKAGVSLAANDAIANEIDFNTEYGTAYDADAEAAIKQAFDDADDGDTIVFDERDFTFVLTSEIKLTNKVVHLRADNVEVIFDGNNDADPEGDTRLLNYNLKSLSDVSIQGITFQNGYSADDGGAVRFRNANLTLSDVTIKNSSAVNEGGGLYHNTGSLTVQNSAFSDNTLVSNANKVHTRGGGLFTVNSSSVSITGSTFSGNELESKRKDAHSQGGGVYINNAAEVTFSSNTLSENTLLTKGNKADTQGGGVYIKATGNITFNSNTISKNSAESQKDISQGSGAYLNTTDTKSVSDNIFKENTGTSKNNNQGGGLFLNGTGSNSVSDNTFESNSITSSNKQAYGGGLYINSTGVKTISGNTVYKNSVTATKNNAHGGGVYLTGNSDLSFKENKVTENSVTSDKKHVYGGGAVLLGNGDFTITENIVSKNVSDAKNSAYGGGLFLNSTGTKTLSGNIITGNTLKAVKNIYGGGVSIFNKTTGTKIFTNNTISGNVLEAGTNARGGAVYSNGNGTINLHYNSFLENALSGSKIHGSGVWVNEAAVELTGNIIHLNSGGDWQFWDNKKIDESGSHNLIGESSRLANLDDALDASLYTSLSELGLTKVTENGYIKYYQLSSSSDLKDAGQASADAATSEDQLGNAIDNGTRDIGAIEYLNVAPEVDFTFSTTDFRTYEFSSDASDEDGAIASYSWDFGEGLSSSASPSFTFSSGGTYSISLTVTDNNGETSTAIKTVTVPYVPVIDNLNQSRTEVDENTLASFSLSFSDSDDTDSHTVTVDWGDGTSTEVSAASGDSFEHTYANDGIFTISVTLTDSFGFSASTSAAITVNNLPPVTSDVSITIDEDNSYTFSISDFAFSDVPADSFEGVAITSIPDNGSLFYNGSIIDLSSGDFFAVDPSLLSYEPAEDNNTNTSFTFKVSDGQDLSDSATMNIEITPVADLPMISVPELSGTTGESVDFIISAEAGAPGETLVVFVNNLPAGTTLSAGEQVGTSWRLTQDQLSDLKINLGNDGSFTPDVTVISIDGDSIAELNVTFSLEIDPVFVTPVSQVQPESEGDSPEGVSLIEGSQTISYKANSLTFLSAGSSLQFDNLALSDDALGVIATLFNGNIEVDTEVADDGVIEVESNPQVYDLSILSPEEQQFIKDLMFGVEVIEDGVEPVENEVEEEEESLSFISDDIALNETLSAQEEVYVLKQSDLDSRLSLEDTLLGEFDCFRS